MRSSKRSLLSRLPDLVQRVFEHGAFVTHDRIARIAGHRRQPRDGVERLSALDETPQLAELLVELLPRTRADEVDSDLGRVLAREADHLLRELDALDRIAHVEDEHVA